MTSISRVSRTLTVLNRCVKHQNVINRAMLSTSQKNKESVAASSDVIPKTKNWISFGFSYKSEEEDTTQMHILFFITVTLCLVTGGYLWTYAPDHKLRDWSQREAFLELRRREEEGLPLIDPNIVDPENFELPSDEELGDAEIII